MSNIDIQPYQGDFFDNESALAVLLRDGILFCNSRDVYYKGEKSGTTIVLYVLMNDVFCWACADAEDLLEDEIQSLYDYHIKDRRWGSVRWCSIKRNQKPQAPIVKYMKEEGSWDEVMENLPENGYDKACKEWYEKSGSKKV